MNKLKRISLILLAFILILGSGCTKQPSSENGGADVSDEGLITGQSDETKDVSTTTAINSKREAFTLYKPDYIVWYHNGEERKYTEDDAPFREIISLTHQRFDEELFLGSCECYIENRQLESLKTSGDTVAFVFDDEINIENRLVYAMYNVLMFPLVYERVDGFPHDNTFLSVDSLHRIGQWIYIAPPDELIDYLETLY